MRRALILYNPIAGRFPVKPFLASVTKTLARSGWNADVIATQSAAHTTESARQAASERYDAVFACGGDGTIGLAASGLAGTDTALGILPSGTANVLAIELGLPIFSWARWWTLKQNAQTLAHSPICSVDVGDCNGQTFLLWAGMGLDAMTIHALEPRIRVEKFLAFPEYFVTTVRNASVWSGVNLRLWADDHEVEGHFMVVVANNIRRYMGGYSILSPDAYIDDGIFDIWLLSGNSLADALRQAYDLWRGNHLTSDTARKLSFRTLRVEADTPFLVQTDGEPRPETTRVEISIRPRALKMLLPPHALGLLSKKI
ncbi:MAG: Diacylglycerol kinase [Anaerolineales bacterium]|nr:Diacylglycerol kinase [Anaerolineales bacterium]